MYESFFFYKGIQIRRTRKAGMDFYAFILNHAPYEVPYEEDVYFLIDLGLSE